ncbi:endonuclease/exonuclease/phosphatase family protein [Metabacillus sp. JX24]|uniref:endonuclease/exonuclease/phosphatase family protein n=1 Tax=Metabacillus sp. JX24 TaxID=3240759 RepID=UPI00351093BC
MKLLTLNCHSWQEENQMEKIRTLALAIKEQSYDVIALQEVSQRVEEPVLYDGVKKNNYALVLLDELKKLGVAGYKLVWGFAHIGYPGFEEGLAILTKHPVVDSEVFSVTKGKNTDYWKTRSIVRADIDYNGQEISFYSCHLGWWHDEEEPCKYQLDSLLQKVDLDKPSFLMGDFNNSAEVRDEGYDYLLSHDLYDTYELAEDKDSGITVKGKIAGWDENKKDLRIDLILVNKEVNVHSSKVIFNDDNRPVVSDHYGVEIEISM